VEAKNRFVTVKGKWQERGHSIRIYLPNRTAIVFIAEENVTQAATSEGLEIPEIKNVQVAEVKEKLEEVKTDTIIEVGC
jgi:hypothetical protein